MTLSSPRRLDHRAASDSSPGRSRRPTRSTWRVRRTMRLDQHEDPVLRAVLAAHDVADRVHLGRGLEDLGHADAVGAAAVDPPAPVAGLGARRARRRGDAATLPDPRGVRTSRSPLPSSVAADPDRWSPPAPPEARKVVSETNGSSARAGSAVCGHALAFPGGALRPGECPGHAGSRACYCARSAGYGRLGSVFHIGVDLAWGVKRPTGLAVLDESGRLVHVARCAPTRRSSPRSRRTPRATAWSRSTPR